MDLLGETCFEQFVMFWLLVETFVESLVFLMLRVGRIVKTYCRTFYYLLAWDIFSLF